MILKTIDFDKFQKIAQNSKKLTIKELLIEIWYYSEGKDIFYDLDDKIIDVIDNFQISINSISNDKLVKEIKILKKEKNKYPFLRFWQILMNKWYIKQYNNEKLEHFINLILFWLSLNFNKTENDWKLIISFLENLKNEKINIWLNKLFSMPIEDFSKINKILIWYLDKIYTFDWNDESFKSLIEEIKDYKDYYLSSYQIFNWLWNEKKIKEFINHINLIPNYNFDFIKSIIQFELKRVKWNLWENDKLYQQIKNLYFKK